MSELLEKVLDNHNLNQAYRKVKANKGVGGVDGKEMESLLEYLKEQGSTINRTSETANINHNQC